MIGWRGIAATFDFLTVFCLLLNSLSMTNYVFTLPLYLLNSISENCCTFCFWFPAEASGIYIALTSDFILFFFLFFLSVIPDIIQDNLLEHHPGLQPFNYHFWTSS